MPPGERERSYTGAIRPRPAPLHICATCLRRKDAVYGLALRSRPGYALEAVRGILSPKAGRAQMKKNQVGGKKDAEGMHFVGFEAQLRTKAEYNFHKVQQTLPRSGGGPNSTARIQNALEPAHPHIAQVFPPAELKPLQMRVQVSQCARPGSP